MYCSALLILVLSLCTAFATAQQIRSVDWDFSYKSILEQNKVADDAFVRRWWAGVRSPAEKWVKGWKGKPILSAILIEYPAFHAAERQTILLVRTADEAQYWELTEELGTKVWAEESEVEEPFSPQIYDGAFRTAWSWKQFAPKSAAELPEQVFPGYMGFISLYGPAGSRQMLLTFQDFFDCPSKQCVRGQSKPGRVLSALAPVLTPDSHKNYKHKPEAEIAAMTPEQRIDEQILEDDVHVMVSGDTQSKLITKYRRLDGSKGLSHLARVMDSYYPKRIRTDRSFAAMMMAREIDDRVVRLRASAEGREVIKAIERMKAKMTDHNGPDSQVGVTLRFLTGTNWTDDSIRNTLWLQHRIKFTDEEFVAFVNFLIETDPSYPSWSERDFKRIKDSEAREVNDLGLPVTQIFVMKDPERFHKAYLAFKKDRAKD